MNRSIALQLKLLLLLLISNHLIAQDTVRELHTVYFETDRSELTDAARAELDALSQKLHSTQVVSLQISGHTDSRANQDYNQHLSERRIAAVMDYLRTHNPDLPTIQSIVANGESKPIADNGTDSGMAQNRRVELLLSYTEEIPEVEKQVSTGNISELYAMLKPEPETFCVQNTRDTFLICSKGTRIFIPAYAFSNKPVQECTRITVSEALTVPDMLLQNLNTVSNKNILVSAGMAEVNALDNSGNKLNLLPGKSVTLFFPTDSTSAEFNTFNGTRANDVHNTLNWNANTFDPCLFYPLQYFQFDNSKSTCERCKFFFCRINRFPVFLSGISDKEIHLQNREFRRCQRKLRKIERMKKKGTYQDNSVQMQLQMQQYGIPTDSTLFQALYGQYMKNNGLKTMEETIAHINRVRDSVARVTDSVTKLRLQTQNLSYQLVNSLQMGYINCDKFLNTGKPLVEIPVNLPYTPQVDGKLILKNYRSIMPLYAAGNGETSYFPNIPKGEPATVFFLKYENGRSYYFLSDIVTPAKVTDIEFIEASPDEIHQKITQLNL